MAISLANVELTNTFEIWRTRTNEALATLNGSTENNTANKLILRDTNRSFSTNAITANSISANISATKLVTTGNVTFSGATVADLGTVATINLDGGTIDGATIATSDITVGSGKTLTVSGTVNFAGATVNDLGNITTVNIDNGTINDTTIVVGGSDTFTLDGGTMDISSGSITGGAAMASLDINSGTIDNCNVTMNTTSTLTTNSGAVFGKDVTNANVAIGNFPEVTGSTRTATSSKSHLHIRNDHAAGSTTSTANGALITDSLLMLEGNTAGATLLANTTSKCTVAFGDSADADIGYISYNHANDCMTFGAGAAVGLHIDDASGGSVMVPGAGATGAFSGKLHVNVGSSDATAGIYIDSNDADKVALDIAAAQTTEKVVNVTASALTSGSMLYLDDTSNDTTARKGVQIIQNHADAVAAQALYVQSDGGTTGITLDKNFSDVSANTVKGLYIDFDQDASSGTATISNIGVDLEVNGNGGGTLTSTGMDIDVVGTSSGTSKTIGMDITVGSADTNYALITSGGNVGIGTATPSDTLTVTGTITESSYRGIKENIRDIDNPLQSVLSLKGVKFDFIEKIRKGAENQTDILGLIAEDTYDVCPELVSTNENGEPIAISYSKISALLIEAIKEQQKEIVELKKKIN